MSLETRKTFKRKRAAFAIEYWEMGIMRVSRFDVPNHFFKALAVIDCSRLCQLSAVLVNGCIVSDGKLYEFREYGQALGYYDRTPPPPLPAGISPPRASAWVDLPLVFDGPPLRGVPDEVFAAEAARLNRQAARAEKKRVKGALPPCGGCRGARPQPTGMTSG